MPLVSGSENVGRFSHASERLRRRSENGFHGGVGAFRTDTTAVRDERGVSVDGVLSDSQQTCRHAQVDRNGSLEMEEPVHIVGARGDNRRLGPDLVSERTDDYYLAICIETRRRGRCRGRALSRDARDLPHFLRWQTK